MKLKKGKSLVLSILMVCLFVLQGLTAFADGADISDNRDDRKVIYAVGTYNKTLTLGYMPKKYKEGEILTIIARCYDQQGKFIGTKIVEEKSNELYRTFSIEEFPENGYGDATIEFYRNGKKVKTLKSENFNPQS